MKVVVVSDTQYWLYFDFEEVVFLQKEAKENNISVKEIVEMIMGMLFIGGYKSIVRKD